MDGYDMGARFHHDVPEAPPYFAINNASGMNQINIRWINPNRTVHGTPLDTIAFVQLWRNGSLIAEVQAATSQDTLEFVDIAPRPDYYRYRILAVDTSGNKGRILYSNENWLGGPLDGIVIWELDMTPITGAALLAAVEEFGYPNERVYNTQTWTKYPLGDGVDAVFVCLGIFPNNRVLGVDEALVLKDYLDSGGNVYMEGGDTWFFDPQTVVHPYFRINATSDGSSDLFNVRGQQGTVYQNMNFVYSGENSWIDHIEPLGGSQKILYNPATSTGVAIANNAGSYKTIGASFEFGGLTDGVSPSTKEELLRKMFDFFGIVITDIPISTDNILLPESFTLKQNFPNPFNLSTTFQFGLPTPGEVAINIYAVTGQKIFSQNLGKFAAGWHELQWNGSNNWGSTVASGIYFYKFVFHNQVETRSVQTGKMYFIK
jgi:hypothetical protein